ncbi:hypothetical protein CERZMDRAFT_81133 [Cercospora zeae-maydis SCOH1-5]|uniref:Uncharacterized protein n=1 Tax=Cercospora zeae-maydis SCOH1-5 TaxID=717836 RepID=A0A6A6FUK6_9PEZI|nr:hypothetical protein CERZMDRAFT_81133 [Cercospora zeae-maydis SCOH1-5]
MANTREFQDMEGKQDALGIESIDDIPDIAANWTDEDWIKSHLAFENSAEHHIERLINPMRTDKIPSYQPLENNSTPQDVPPEQLAGVFHGLPNEYDVFQAAPQNEQVYQQYPYPTVEPQRYWPDATVYTTPTYGLVDTKYELTDSSNLAIYPSLIGNTNQTPLPQTTGYRGFCPTVSDAYKVLASPDLMIPLGVLNDDWQIVKAQDVHYYAARIFDALTILPTVTPKAIDNDFVQDYWRSHQEKQLVDVRNHIATYPVKAEAHILVLIDELLKLHEFGTPASVAAHKPLKEGYRLEHNMAASARLELIIANAAADKYVAWDILNGNNVIDMVRSPALYLSRKISNSKVNGKKAMDKLQADRARGVLPENARANGSTRKKGGKKKQRNVADEGASSTPASYPTPVAYPTPVDRSPARQNFFGLPPPPFPLDGRDGGNMLDYPTSQGGYGGGFGYEQME